jgi:hypothetical protein
MKFDRHMEYKGSQLSKSDMFPCVCGKHILGRKYVKFLPCPRIIFMDHKFFKENGFSPFPHTYEAKLLRNSTQKLPLIPDVMYMDHEFSNRK